jgi:hypothetical protein
MFHEIKIDNHFDLASSVDFLLIESNSSAHEREAQRYHQHHRNPVGGIPTYQRATSQSVGHELPQD